MASVEPSGLPAMRLSCPTLTLLLVLPLALAGCDMLGIESGTATAARKEAEGKAIGGACRHAMRAIEDCYTLNPKAQKAAVFAGWREMDEYLRETKSEGIAPVIPRKVPGQAAPASDAASASDDGDAGDKAADGHAKDEGAEKAPKAKPKRTATTH